MILNNTLSEIGDVLFIKTKISIVAKSIQLKSYTESVIGETNTRFFDRKFRVSHDGLIYTDWYDLNTVNVLKIKGDVTNNIVFIEYRYERQGTDLTGLLEFVSVTMKADSIELKYDLPIIQGSIFKGLSVGNFVTMQLCSNLLKKLYEKGIIPAYIERGESVENDKDYIDFWSAIACYMSMFVTFMSRFENIRFERDLLIEYLKQLGIYICDNSSDIEGLQYIANNLFDEVRKRGTSQIFMRKGTEYFDKTKVNINGEVLRILCIGEHNEFLWTLRNIKNAGWNIGNSSPLYQGTYFDDNLIKGFEKTKECLDLSKYITFGTVNNNNGTINLSGTSGIGWKDFNSQVIVNDKGLVVDAKFNYEITFSVKSTSKLGKLNFGCHGFDNFNNKYDFLEIDSNNKTNSFVADFSVNKINQYYFVRGIVYSFYQNSINSIEKHLNFSKGKNLKFGNKNINRISPYIHTSGSDFTIYDFKVRPVNYAHSLGLLNMPNMIEIFTVNKNNKKNIDEIYEIIKHELIPYNTNLLVNTVNQTSSEFNVVKI